MAQFKKGDKVRALRGGWLGIQPGEVFTVSNPAAGHSNPAGYIRLEEFEQSYPGHNVDVGRFELVPEQPREFTYRSKHVKGGKVFGSLEEVEQYVLGGAGTDIEFQIVEIVPVKTVKVARVLEEVKA
ncbi:hypothetical protein CAL26_21220 [Bordetella genomosp. 9]|uniref:Uncharacterized protein n=1 Tax=Bordetella genomosp. 9 TaxID=1416803 RepID=A0A261R4X7_9BORD|nr:hypothetical protein [Bordetella genomosp. 9]OZI20078.1 hypothetical protein CAL26_21220 [Bordetella genomosp. 9]